MKKAFGYLTVLIIFILVTLFGLGPVLLADGTLGERMITLAIVLILYALLIVLYRYIRKKK